MSGYLSHQELWTRAAHFAVAPSSSSTSSSATSSPTSPRGPPFPYSSSSGQRHAQQSHSPQQRLGHKSHQSPTSSIRSSLDLVPYRPLAARELENVLRRTANPYTEVLVDAGGARRVGGGRGIARTYPLKADGVDFQPHSGSVSQDRYVIEQFSVRGREDKGLWTLSGVFDGEYQV